MIKNPVSVELNEFIRFLEVTNIQTPDYVCIDF